MPVGAECLCTDVLKGVEQHSALIIESRNPALDAL